jgi:predicted small metal-binding protein
MFAGKALRCDCGYEVRAYDAAGLVEAIRRHASEAHRIDFSVELALDVAQSARQAPSEREELEFEHNGVIGKEERRMPCDGE